LPIADSRIVDWRLAIQLMIARLMIGDRIADWGLRFELLDCRMIADCLVDCRLIIGLPIDYPIAE
jgi:hypothetical protein